MRDNDGKDVSEVVLGVLQAAEDKQEEAIQAWFADHALIGGYLAVVRMERRVSMCRLARQMGITQPYLSMLESGKRAWTAALFERWQVALSAVS